MSWELLQNRNERMSSAFSRRGSDLWRWASLVYRRLLLTRQRSPRQLRLCETLSLGERRFVAVVQVGQTRFLLGGTPQSLALLARLPDWKEEECTTIETHSIPGFNSPEESAL